MWPSRNLNLPWSDFKAQPLSFFSKKITIDMSSLDTQARSVGGLRRELSATLGGWLRPLQCYGKGASP